MFLHMQRYSFRSISIQVLGAALSGNNVSSSAHVSHLCQCWPGACTEGVGACLGSYILGGLARFMLELILSPWADRLGEWIVNLLIFQDYFLDFVIAGEIGGLADGYET